MINQENQDYIAVLDFGSQYNQLIVRRIREQHVKALLLDSSTTLKEAKEKGNLIGVIFSGGPESVTSPNAPACDPDYYSAGIPVLGICYGMQLMMKDLGGQVESANRRQYGRAELQVLIENPLFTNLPESQQVWMSHGDHVEKQAPGFEICASSPECAIAAVQDVKRNLFGLQFHPEVQHSINGQQILNNFLFGICKAKGDWTMAHFLESKKEEIRKLVKEDRVLLGISGGVDSSVVAALLQQAIGDQLVCVFVDHGLLRKNEGEKVMKALEALGANIIKVDASQAFLKKLDGITDPEQKRKIIGKEFIETFDQKARELSDQKPIPWLAQGTLYTDVIESGTSSAQTIKSHHNVGGLPEKMDFKLIEPLNTLFKDEVRELGSELGLPLDLVWRQPFPGPGLAIRILGEITPEKLEMVRESDAILQEEIAKAQLDRDIWQYFTALTNMKSVGVMGDQRTYDYAIAIRAVTSKDGMTADWARIPFDVLAKISDRIVNEVPHVNRVLLDITSKPPGTIEFE